MVAQHVLNSQARDVTNKLFSQKTFSSLPIRSKIKSVKQYLNDRYGFYFSVGDEKSIYIFFFLSKYKNDFINESFNSLMKATQSKSMSISSKYNKTNNESDEESEVIIRMSKLNNSKF